MRFAEMIIGIAFIATGIKWHRLEMVSAERPASLLVAFGIGFAVLAMTGVLP
jgi:hypothetical protein